MPTAIHLSRLKFKTETELNQIKSAIDTLKAYDLGLGGMNLLENMVDKEIGYRIDAKTKTT